MALNCFSCKNKTTIPVPKEIQKGIRDRRRDLNLTHLYTPDVVFYCIMHMKSIEQIDPACEYYSESSLHKTALNTLKTVVKDLKKGLNDEK